ncbi:UNVERIFIED_CONTAM: hypothetical protein K2H54_073416 [Gekko kuhli]
MNRSNTPLNCSGSLDVLPFILPHRPDNSESCAMNGLPEILWVEKRMQAHVGRVRDVELLTEVAATSATDVEIMMVVVQLGNWIEKSLFWVGLSGTPPSLPLTPKAAKEEDKEEELPLLWALVPHSFLVP